MSDDVKGFTTEAREMLLRLEDRVGGAGATAQLLGVARSTSYHGYKNGAREIPRYIVSSLRAHLQLSDRQLKSLQESEQEKVG